MKTLIAAACIAVLAATGYYFIGEYRSHLRIVARQDDADAARQELFSMAGAKPGEDRKVTRWCAWTDGRYFDDDETRRLARQLVQNCRALGFI